MSSYWNHNTAYHPWIDRIAADTGSRDFLDVGCGDGLLLERLSPGMRSATGLEPDQATSQQARARLAGTPNITLAQCGFLDYSTESARFDFITLVASLHHIDLTSALRKAADLLRPSGTLLIVGLAANRSPTDWVLAGLSVPIARIGSLVHHETRATIAPTVHATESLSDIRCAATEFLPGSKIRRGLYYRYLLRWTKPDPAIEAH